MKKQLKKLCLTVMMSLLSSFFLNSTLSRAEGGLSISQTRVVFDAKAKSTKVTLSNQSDRVYLVSSRVLSAPDSDRQKIEALPFMVTPPLFRLEKESRNSVLISKNDTSVLPTDRESVFYLSFLAIPSVEKNRVLEPETDTEIGMTTTQVSFGIRTVIKLFYRPSGLSLSAAEAPKKLIFEQHGSQLIVNNPTPYYVTFAQLTINEKNVNVRDQGAMMAPFSTHAYLLKEGEKINRITWSVINEFGGISELFHWSR